MRHSQRSCLITLNNASAVLVNAQGEVTLAYVVWFKNNGLSTSSGRDWEERS